MGFSKKDILDYVKNTPDNTNVNVLAPMLDEYASGDNKEEIELTVITNGTYIPETGKTYKKVIVNVNNSSEIIDIIFSPPLQGDDIHIFGRADSEYSLQDLVESPKILHFLYEDPITKETVEAYGIYLPPDVEFADITVVSNYGIQYYIKINQSGTAYEWILYGG